MATTTSFEDIDMEGVVFIERLKSDSFLYQGYVERPYNPDEIAKKKPPFGIYDDMKRDDQIKAVLWIKKFMVLSSGWDIEIQNPGDESIKEEIEENLTAIEGPEFSDVLTNILTHLDYGFSITEPIFDIAETENGPKVILKKLKTRAPHAFTIHTDEFGDITQFEQDTSTGPNFVSPHHLMLMIHQYEFGVPYGTSDLQSCYRPWFSKSIVIKFWNIYLERFGSPFIVGTVPPNTSKADKDKLQDILKNIQAKTGITVPEGVKIDLKSQSTGATDFERAIDKHNMMMARSLLIPDLMGLSGAKIGGGSFALGKKQFEIFYFTIEKIRIELQRAINKYVIRPLLLWNYGIKGPKTPKWVLRPLDTPDKLELQKLWIEAIKGNIWEPTDDEINQFRTNIRYPIGPIKKPKQEANKGFPGSPFNPPKKEFSNDIGLFVHRGETAFEKKVDFVKVKNDLQELDIKTIRSLMPAFEKIKEGIIESVKSSNLIEKQRMDKINSFQLKFVKQLQLAWKLSLGDIWSSGQQSARKELGSEKFQTKDPHELFESILDERSFFVTGIERDRILRDTKQILLDGIEQGLSNREIQTRVEKLFRDNYLLEEGAVFDPTKPGFSLPNRIETIVRTNVTKIYNQGRRNIFEDPNLKGFVKAYQYSAIIDSRTTDICTRLDGKVYRASDPYIDRITPPNHFNCRSILVPVTEGESFEVSDQAVKDDDLERFRGVVG